MTAYKRHLDKLFSEIATYLAFYAIAYPPKPPQPDIMIREAGSDKWERL